MKKVFKIGLFYFMAFSMVLGNSVTNIDFSTAIANAQEVEIPIVETTTTDKYTVCHATGSASNPWERVNISESAVKKHEDHGPDYVVLDNENTALCPDPEPYPVPVVLANFQSGNTSALIGWDEITDERLDGYKVVFSETDPNPAYPTTPYIAWITNSTVTSYVHDYEFVCGQDYYYSVTARYDDGSLYKVGNAVTLNFACGGGGFSCPDADAEFDVDMRVMPEGCVVPQLPLYPATDSAVISLLEAGIEAGNYTVMAEVHRSDLADTYYIQDEEEFSLRVNSSLEGPVALDQDLAQTVLIQNVGDFDFDSGTNTVYMDTKAPACVSPSPTIRNSVEVKKLCLYKNEEPQPFCGDYNVDPGEDCDDGPNGSISCTSECTNIEDPEYYTIKAAKVICEDEETLPNWGGGDVVNMIDIDTAADFVAQNKDNCILATDWEFQYGINVSDPGNDFYGHAGNGWTDFTSATADGVMAEVKVPVGDFSTIKVREVLKDGYIPFTHPESGESAEFYCYNDILNYDNYDFIRNPNIETTYYCVAFNVLEKPEEPAPWCSALYGLMKDYYNPDSSAHGIYNEVIDLKKDGVINLSDTALLASMYYEADDAVCYSQFEDPEDEFHFSCKDYETIGWCGGLLKGVTDFYGKAYENNDLSPRFDLNNDDVINLSDLALVTTLYFADDQVSCYDYLVPPLPEMDCEDQEECSIADNLLVNSSFEEPEVTNNSLWQKMSSVLGWAIERVSDSSTTTLELHRGWSGNVAAEGLQYSELDGDHSTRVKQSVVTEAGAQYKLFWSFAARHNIAPDQNHLAIKVDGIQVATNGPASGIAPLAQEDWTKSNYTFTASNTNTELAFEDISPSDSFGTFLDDVRLCKVADAKPYCGDGNIDKELGETCDGDKPLVCVTDAGYTGTQECNMPLDLPTLQSVKPTYCVWNPCITDDYCGDEETNGLEQCDDGPNGSDTCTTECTSIEEPADPAPWCSALLGIVKGYYQEDNLPLDRIPSVIDLNDDGVVNLSDVALVAQLHSQADDVVCYSHFENLTSNEQEFYFQCEDTNVDWCEGLVQGVTDFYGQSYINNDLSPRYDLNKDGVINLSDLALVATLNGDNDQVACYTYYVPPFLMCPADNIPVITLLGNDTVTLTQGSVYADSGATADDVEDGDITVDIVTVNHVNTLVVGTYTITYNVIDSDNNAAVEVTRTVNVIPAGGPDPVCGNGIQEEGEACDAGPDGSSTCSTQCEVIQTGCVGSCGGGTTFAIRDLKPGPSCGAFDISWRTTKNSDTILDFGTESGVYTQNINNDTNTRNHSLAFEDLEANTTYYYQVRAISSNGREIKVSEKSFTTPPKEQCEEVLGEKIVPEPLMCDFLRASGSKGIDKDIDGVFQYPNGTLLRDYCDRGEGVYLLRDQKKWHVPNWQYLHDNYFGQRIYNVLTTVIDSYPDWTGGLLGVKEYGDGTLLRSSNMKIYVLEKGHKQHVNTLEKLAQYAGQEIINVSDEVLKRY
jgi:hypothetical protein